MESQQALLGLSALAQETRLAIFRRLVRAGPEGESAGAIADALKHTGADTLISPEGTGTRGPHQPAARKPQPVLRRPL